MTRRVVGITLLSLGCAMSQRPAGAPSEVAQGPLRETQARPSEPAPLASGGAPAAQTAVIVDESYSPAQPATPRPSRPAPAPPTQPVQGLDAAPEPTSAPARNTPGGGATAATFDRAEALRGHQAALAAAVTLLRADAATCRDVCGASTTICRAAGEICRLTGDAQRDAPTDARCRDARRACSDAGRQRDRSCPTCPEPR